MNRLFRRFFISHAPSSAGSSRPSILKQIKDNASIITLFGGAWVSTFVGLNYIFGLQIKPLEVKIDSLMKGGEDIQAKLDKGMKVNI